MPRISLKQHVVRHCAAIGDGISQSEFARRLGVDPKRLSGYLAGRETSTVIAKALGALGFPACTRCGRGDCQRGCTVVRVDIARVRARLDEGAPAARVAQELGLSQSTVYRIKARAYTAQERREKKSKNLRPGS